MIRHSTVKAIIHHCISYVDASGEDLVQTSTHLMCASVLIKCQSEVQKMQFAVHLVDVIVEVTTHNNGSICILLNDILDDILHSLRSLSFEWSIPWCNVSIKYLYLMFISYQEKPLEIGF